MGKFVVWVLVVWMAGGVALAKKPMALDHWDAVEALRPGEEIDVLSGSQAGPDECLMSSVDDSTLTCLAEDFGRDTRLVFPRSAVRDVWVIEAAPNRHIAAWVGIAVLTGLGIALCVEAGPAGALILALIAVPVVTVAEETPPWPVALPPPMPRMPRMRRRLVYQCVTP